MIDPTRPTPARMASVTDSQPPVDQIRATTTLLALIQEGAPSARWLLPADTQLGYTHLPHLEGHLTTGTDRERLSGLAEWQRIIGAGPVDVTRVGIREHHKIRGSYEGLAVEVLTIVDGAPVCCDQCQGHDGDAA